MDTQEILERRRKLLLLKNIEKERVLAASLKPGEAEIREKCKDSLIEFTRRAWHILEPQSRKFVEGWAIWAMAEHLQAVTDGDISKLLINVPPGFMKSLLCKVFWPAWMWGPCNRPDMRFISASYAEHLSTRDARKMRMVLQSEWYQRLWPHVKLSSDQAQKTNFHNTHMGFMLGTSVSGVGTGERGDIFIIDDPNSIKEAESETVRNETNRWFGEVVPTRVNDPEKSAFVVIQQRVHENDVTGYILENNLEYEHLCLPMEYEVGRKCRTSIEFYDPREHEGELLWPERFPKRIVEELKKSIGSSYAIAAQFQQSPTPKGGGIIRRQDWQLWGNPDDDQDPAYKEYPRMDFIVASLDPAYTEKQENDFSGFSIFGVYKNEQYLTRVMMMYAAHWRLGLNPLVNQIADLCRVFKVDKLLIESKASGLSVAQEMHRLYSGERWGVQTIDPRGDKVARAYSIQHLFEQGLIYAPDKEWAELAISETESLPKGRFDDVADSVIQAVRYLRDTGWALRNEERESVIDTILMPKGRPRVLYDV